MRKFITVIATSILLHIPTTANAIDLSEYELASKPQPAPQIQLRAPWTDSEFKHFQMELYRAAKSESNSWDELTTDPGLMLLTECIARYYAESISYPLAQVFLDSMPEERHREFNRVIEQCYEFVRSNDGIQLEPFNPDEAI